jgi:hypothetical protein
MSILALNQVSVKPEVFIIRAYDYRATWSIEVVFKGGAVVVVPATVDEVNALESELAEAEGWKVNPSLYTNGFNARRLEVKADDPIPFSGQPCYSYTGTR